MFLDSFDLCECKTNALYFTLPLFLSNRSSHPSVQNRTIKLKKKKHPHTATEVNDCTVSIAHCQFICKLACGGVFRLSLLFFSSLFEGHIKCATSNSIQLIFHIQIQIQIPIHHLQPGYKIFFRFILLIYSIAISNIITSIYFFILL